MRRLTARSASTSRPESISASTAIFGARTPSCSVSLRFLSPPDRTTRLMPFRMLRPDTPARRSVMTSSLRSLPATTPTPALVRSRNHHHDVAVLDLDLVHGGRLRGRQRLRLTGDQRERAPVLPALDLALVAVDLALGQREVRVRACVADRIHVVVAAHERDVVLADVESSCGARREVGHASDDDPLRHRGTGT